MGWGKWLVWGGEGEGYEGIGRGVGGWVGDTGEEDGDGVVVDGGMVVGEVAGVNSGTSAIGGVDEWGL